MSWINKNWKALTVVGGILGVSAYASKYFDVEPVDDFGAETTMTVEHKDGSRYRYSETDPIYDVDGKVVGHVSEITDENDTPYQPIYEAEDFGAETTLPRLTPKQMDFLRYSSWARAYEAYATGISTRGWNPREWKEDYTICKKITHEGYDNAIARKTLQSLLEKKVVKATDTSYVRQDGRIRKSYAEQVNENPSLVKNITQICLVLTPIGLEILKRMFAQNFKDVVGWKIELTFPSGDTAYLHDVPNDIGKALDSHIGDVKWDSQTERFGAETQTFEARHKNDGTIAFTEKEWFGGYSRTGPNHWGAIPLGKIENERYFYIDGLIVMTSPEVRPLKNEYNVKVIMDLLNTYNADFYNSFSTPIQKQRARQLIRKVFKEYDRHTKFRRGAEDFGAETDYDDYIDRIFTFIDEKVGTEYFPSDEDEEEVARFKKDFNDEFDEVGKAIEDANDWSWNEILGAEQFLPNGVLRYYGKTVKEGQEGVFKGAEVKIIKIQEVKKHRMPSVIIYEYLDEEGNPLEIKGRFGMKTRDLTTVKDFMINFTPFEPVNPIEYGAEEDDEAYIRHRYGEPLENMSRARKIDSVADSLKDLPSLDMLFTIINNLSVKQGNQLINRLYAGIREGSIRRKPFRHNMRMGAETFDAENDTWFYYNLDRGVYRLPIIDGKIIGLMQDREYEMRTGFPNAHELLSNAKEASSKSAKLNASYGAEEIETNEVVWIKKVITTRIYLEANDTTNTYIYGFFDSLEEASEDAKLMKEAYGEIGSIDKPMDYVSGNYRLTGMSKIRYDANFSGGRGAFFTVEYEKYNGDEKIHILRTYEPINRLSIGYGLEADTADVDFDEAYMEKQDAERIMKLLRIVRRKATGSNARYAKNYAREAENAYYQYGMKGLKVQVAYVLSNLGGWRGDEAKEVKAELRKLTK